MLTDIYVTVMSFSVEQITVECFVYQTHLVFIYLFYYSSSEKTSDLVSLYISFYDIYYYIYLLYVFYDIYYFYDA